MVLVPGPCLIGDHRYLPEKSKKISGKTVKSQKNRTLYNIEEIKMKVVIITVPMKAPKGIEPITYPVDGNKSII